MKHSSSTTTFIEESWLLPTGARDLKIWQELHGYLFLVLYRGFGRDLADRPELAQGGFYGGSIHVFLGIETPSAESLKENQIPECSRREHQGADSRDSRRPDCGCWAALSSVSIPTTTPSSGETIRVHHAHRHRLGHGGRSASSANYSSVRPHAGGRRLIEDSEATSNFSAPNFRTIMPLPVLLRGLSRLLATLYEPKAFFDRAFRSLQIWKTRPMQRPPELPMSYNLRVLFSSIWTQGIRSGYWSPIGNSWGGWRVTGGMSRPSCGWASWCCSPRSTSWSTRRKSPRTWNFHAGTRRPAITSLNWWVRIPQSAIWRYKSSPGGGKETANNEPEPES